MEAKVVFSDDKLKQSFEELKDKDERLFKEIEGALSEIKNNAFVGRNVKKNLIPKIYSKKYNIDNLWIYNLRKDWRLLYTIGRDEIEVLAIILDWMNHKDYERLFGF